MKILQFDLVSFGYNNYGGFYFSILDLDCCRPNIDSSIFGIGFSKHYLQISLLYFNITIWEK